MRRGLWSHIPTRDHTPHQIYTHGTDQLQLMSRGHIKYQHHMGHEADNEWAAYYELEKDEKGVPKLQKIHIITVSNVVLCFNCGVMGLTRLWAFVGF